jgi:hypothetical protein
MTVHEAPSVRFTQPVVSVSCNNTVVVVEVALSPGAMLGAGLGASVRVDLSDASAAVIVGDAVLSWAPGGDGAPALKQVIVQLLRAPPAGRLEATLTAVSNVVVDASAGTAQIAVPAPTFSYEPNQVAYLSGATPADAVVAIPVAMSGCSPFPSALAYAASVVSLRGCMAPSSCPNKTSAAGVVHVVAGQPAPVVRLPLAPFLALPGTAELRLGLALTPVAHAAVTPQANTVAAFVFGAAEDVCPPGSVAPVGDSNGQGGTPGGDASEPAELGALASMQLATFSAETASWVTTDVLPAFSPNTFSYTVLVPYGRARKQVGAVVGRLRDPAR